MRELIASSYGPAVPAGIAQHLQVEEGCARGARSHSTDLGLAPSRRRSNSILQEDEFKVYKLIWQRFVASQMNPAVFDQTTVDIDAKNGNDVYRFRVTGSVLKFEGFLKVYEESKDAKDEEDEALKHKLPVLDRGPEAYAEGTRSPNSTSPSLRRALTKRRW